MTSDQRRCIQRSRFVCRILNFCVKKVLEIHLWELESAEGALLLRGERMSMAKITPPPKAACEASALTKFQGTCADGTNPFRPTVTRKKLEV